MSSTCSGIDVSVFAIRFRPLLWLGFGCSFLSGCSGCVSELNVVSQSKAPEQAESAKANESQPSGVKSSQAELAAGESSSSGDEFPANNEQSSAYETGPLADRDSSDKKSAGAEQSRPLSPHSGNAEGAWSTAITLRDKARSASERKNYGSAFELASQAWEVARTHPQDARLKQLADELSSELEQFGQQANSKFTDRTKSTNTKLIEK